tara:strand:+ start:40 stop:804 length:765 start_codon:yes stop_codon:yes gene_type:complete
MSAATVWSASASLSLNTIVTPTNPVTGLFFRVTQAGTTGSSEPSWPRKIGEVAYDNNVRYVAFSSVFADISKLNPFSVIELFSLELNNNFHGEVSTQRFHSGTNTNGNGDIVWAGDTYTRFPVEATGFAYQRGQIPRPKIIVSNALGTISEILNRINARAGKAGNDLTGAVFTRITTMAQFLDAANFSGGSNPFGTPDPNAEFERQIYLVDRKATENREIVEFELSAVSDLAGVRLPKRQCTRALFPAIGTFVQ